MGLTKTKGYLIVVISVSLLFIISYLLNNGLLNNLDLFLSDRDKLISLSLESGDVFNGGTLFDLLRYNLNNNGGLKAFDYNIIFSVSYMQLLLPFFWFYFWIFVL